jgi:hypothetical protein
MQNQTNTNSSTETELKTFVFRNPAPRNYECTNRVAFLARSIEAVKRAFPTADVIENNSFNVSKLTRLEIAGGWGSENEVHVYGYL